MSEHRDNPWDGLETPSKQSAMNSKRVAFEYPWDFFWAKDIQGSAILLLRHDLGSAPTQELPKLSGLQIEAMPSTDPQVRLLVFRLLDWEHIELFHNLCLDIMEACREASSLAVAVEIAVRRTWRWHDLLRGGKRDKLSLKEQQGLIAELLVLRRRLFPCLSIRDSLESWTGPDGTPRDFEVGRIGIEAKARRGSSKAFIEISSADQLDIRGADRVFLCVTELDKGTDASPSAFTLTEIVREIHAELESAMLIDELDLFSARLGSAGFEWLHDYETDLWVEGETSLFEVKDDFPRLESSSLAAGIDRVRYSLQLSAIESFRVAERDVDRALTEHRGAAI